MRTLSVFAVLAICALAVTGCPKKTAPGIDAPQLDYETKLGPGQLALRKITDPKRIPDFTQACADTAGLRESIERSIAYLSKPSSQQHFPYGEISHQQAIDSLRAMLALLDSGLAPAQMNASIRQRFDVYESVGCDMKGTVLFTGYYTPIFNGSPVRTEQFRYPLYKQPAGLTKNADGTPTAQLPERRAIEQSNMYAGNELVWMADPFEAFVVHIQGSARLRYPDGQEVAIGYAANNGHDYNSIRAEMVKDGKIAKYAGLQAMIDYFKAHPNEVQTYTWRNKRFVFFAFSEDGQARGCLNEPVTTMRTIATDKTIYPRACLAMVSAKLPRRSGSQIVQADYRGFALDQDAGGGIRAAGRCDVYMGVGAGAGQLAGSTKEEGRLYYLFLKPAPAAPLAPVATPGSF